MKTTKNLAIVVLALGVMVWPASVASGAQYLTVNGASVTSITLELGQSRTVEVVSTDGTSYVDYVGFDNGVVLGDFSHLETKPEAGNLATVLDYNQPAFYGYYVSAAGISPTPSAGVHFIFEYVAQELGTTDVKLYDSTFGYIDSVHITVIPLPPVAMGTAFTYQGRLLDVNSPADGLYDLQFKLYDNLDPVFAAQQGSTIDINDLDVIDGYFTVELDFGSAIFDGEAHWLETAVRPGDSTDPNAFVTLSPRTEMTPTPYALYAQTAGADSDWMISGNNMYAIPSGNVGIGTTSPDAKLSIQMPRGAIMRPSTVGGLVIKHNLLNIANQLEVQDALGNTSFVVHNTGDVGIGTMSPGAKLDVRGNIKADKVVYSSARTYYYAVSGDEFSPRTNSGSTYRRGYGNGGAYMLSGPERVMSAGVHLPQGAVITEFEAFFYDSDTGKDLTATLHKKLFTYGYTPVAEVTSSGISGFGSNSDSSISVPSTVDNRTGTYQVHAFAIDWSTSGSKLIIMGALVTYTLDEAQ